MEIAGQGQAGQHLRPEPADRVHALWHGLRPLNPRPKDMTMAKHYARITRDIVREINLGPLVVTGLANGATREIAPSTVHRMPLAADSVSVFATKRARDAYVVAINAENPNAAECTA